MRKIIFAAILFLTCVTLSAQNTIPNQYSQFGGSASGMDGNRYDRNGNPIDTTAVIDANTIPIGLFSWKIDERLGNIFETPVDTIQHAFQNTNDTGGPTGHYTYLGNLGAPRISHVFFERKETSQFFFTDPYDFTVRRPEDIVYTNTKSPFTNLTYYKQGDGRYGEERFKAYFAVNVNKRLGFGFDIDYTYGRGKYTSQSTALFNGNLFAYYRGDNYDMHFSFINENLKVAENGGIADDRYITHPLEMAEGRKTYATYDIPINLNDIWNKNTGYHAFLTHRYNLGFYRDVTQENDTVTRTVFVPVTSFIHTVKMDMNRRKYISYDKEQNQTYFQNNYLGNDSTDVTKHFSIKNTVGISLREGFNKWAKAGLTAFMSFEHRRFTLTDTLDGTAGRRIPTDHKENILSVGGQLIKEQGKTIHYNVLGEVALIGEDAGQFSVEGQGDLNFRLFGDTVRLEANAYIKNLNPTFYFRHFHSKHYWWDNEDLSKIMRTRIEGKLNIDRWRTQLKVGVENIKNYTYLDNTSIKIADKQNEVSFKNNIAVRQHSGNIQVFNAALRQDFKLGILHLDNEVVYQKSSNQQVLPLPDLVLYHNLYIQFGLAKRVLNIELGADVRYFTQYYAPDYAPAIGQFYLQNPETRFKLGGYPLVNAYLNLHLKRTRIFVQMYNLIQGTGEKSYFLAPHYPLNPRILKVGLSWNFFD
ncbi:MAG: putative porin [Bacteroides sp.]|nr:putative porin [Bacteroides sp.]